MTDYIIKLSTEQLSGSITYVNSPDPPSSPTLEVEDFWRIRLNQIKTESEVVNMVDSDTKSLQIKNLYQTIFAVPLAQGVTWAV